MGSRNAIAGEELCVFRPLSKFMKEKIKIFPLVILFIAVILFGNPSNVNASALYGYICSGDSIGCSAISAIYKIFKDDSNTFYICGKDSTTCSFLNAIYKVKKYDSDTYYVCSGDSIGCSSLSDIYRVEVYNSDTMYVCSGDSIGCSSLGAVYRVKVYDANTMYICSGSSIGCSSLGAIYKVKLTYNTNDYNSLDFYGSQLKTEQDKLAQLKEEERKLTEAYLDALRKLDTPQYTCPPNSTLQGTLCYCNEGYVISGNACITINQYCQNLYGVNSYGVGKQCYCSIGYEFDSSRNTCVKSVICPLNSTKINNICVCNEGYIMRNNTCITYTEDCIRNFGQNVYGTKGTNNSNCYCKEGYEWNPSRTACIKIESKEVNISQTEPSPISEKPTSLSQDTNKEEETNLVSEERHIQEQNQQQVSNGQKPEQKKSLFMFLASIFDAIKNFFSQLFK